MSSANKNTSEKTAVQETSDFWFQYRTQKNKAQNLFREGRKQIIVFYVPSIHPHADILLSYKIISTNSIL